MPQLGLLETPLEGPGAALGDLAVDEQREPVLEGHGVEVVAGHLFEEGGQHAGQAKGGDALGHGVVDVGHVKASGPRMLEWSMGALSGSVSARSALVRRMVSRPRQERVPSSMA